MSAGAYIAIAVASVLVILLVLDAALREGKRAEKFLRRMDIKFRVVDVTRDRRSKAQFEAERAMLQASADATLEKLWQKRVLAKTAKRRQLSPMILLPYSAHRTSVPSQFRIKRQAG